MIRVALVAVILAAAAPAALAGPSKDPKAPSQKAQRKDLPPGVAEKASEAFAKARELDEAGDLPHALSAYLEAGQIYPHPNTTYNIADVYRRMNRYHDAIEAYVRYLQQVPDAPDHVAVEKILEDLRNTPGELEILASTTNEQTFVDGEPVGTLPQTLQLHEGMHVVDVITPISYAWMFCQVRMGLKEQCSPKPVPRMDGNVVISGPRHVDNKRWRETGAFFMIRERFELRHGLYDLGELAYKQCRAVQVEIPKGENIVTYIYATVPEEHPKGDQCVTVTAKVRTVKL